MADPIGDSRVLQALRGVLPSRPEVASDARLCEAILLDLCPVRECRAAVRVIAAAVRCGVPQSLASDSRGAPLSLLGARLAERLQADLGLAEENAAWAVETWAAALGLELPARPGAFASRTRAAARPAPPPAREERPLAPRPEPTPRPPRPWIPVGIGLGLVALGVVYLGLKPGASASGRSDPGAGTPPAAAGSVAVELEEPAEGFLVRGPEVRVSGSVRGGSPPPASLRIGGSDVAVRDGRFATVLRAPGDGPFEVVVGRGGEAPEPVLGRRSGRVDGTPPRIDVAAPRAQRSEHRTRVAHVRGRAVDDTLAQVRVAGAPVPTTSDGSFDVPVELPEDGTDVRVVVEASDRAGNATSSVTLFLKHVPEVPAWQGLLDQALQAAQAGDWEKARARLDEAKEKGVPLAKVPASLTDGLRAQAHVAEAVRRAREGDWPGVERDLEEAKRLGAKDRDVPASVRAGLAAHRAPPVLEVEAPTDGAVVESREVEVRGSMTTGRSTDRLHVNGTPVEVAQGRFRTRVTVAAETRSRIVVSVVDGAAPRAEVVRTVTHRRRREAWETFLEGWAEPVGTARDAATGHPRRIRRTRDGGVMALVPAGTFLMGAVSADHEESQTELPRHRVTLSKAYYMDVTEVTNAQFAAFVEATDYRTRAERDGFGLVATDEGETRVPGRSWRTPGRPGSGRPAAWDRLPAVFLAWEDADAFAEWCGAALPTEAQFEHACRGTSEGTKYTWGDAYPPPAGAVNVAGEEYRRAFPERAKTSLTIAGYDDGVAERAAVGSFSATSHGLHDLLGNVSEWAADWYGPYEAGAQRDPGGPSTGTLRVVRGASFMRACDHCLTIGRRFAEDPATARDWIGFRCAKTLP